MEKVTVLGAGAFGTAMATVLATNGCEVVLWCYEPEVADQINKARRNDRYLPGVILHENIRATNDLQVAVTFSKLLFEALPVSVIRSMFMTIKEWLSPDSTFVVLSKGVEIGTTLLPVDIILSVLGKEWPIAVIGGPNYAHEIANKVRSAATLASNDPSFTKKLEKILNNDYFSVVCITDYVGTQVCGAFKNALALSLGIAHGSGLGENTKAFLMFQALKEMGILSKSLGGSDETVYELCGLGDLILCCTGSASRNFKMGVLLGQGRSLASLSNEFSVMPEGIGTLRSVKSFIGRYSINLPLCAATYDFIFDGKCSADGNPFRF